MKAFSSIEEESAESNDFEFHQTLGGRERKIQILT